MGTDKKRKLEDTAEQRSNKKKRGFKVGPDNLPDGTYLRKVKKIKSNLIQKAKIKKDFAKVKARIQDDPRPKPVYTQTDEPATEPASLELHPDRMAMLEAPSISTQPQRQPRTSIPRQQAFADDAGTSSNDFVASQRKRAKIVPFSKEAQLAQKEKEEAEIRRRQREEAEIERRKKNQDRERMRAAMAKARKPGRDGQRKLGRESVVLLEKVKRLVGNG